MKATSALNDKASPTLQHYYPHRLNRLGLRAYPLMIRELINARALLSRLIWRDLLLRMKVSFLGLFWSIAQPLALMTVFIYLKKADVIRLGDTPVAYAAFAFVGIIHWNAMTSMLTQSAQSLLGAANLVAKVKFPREVLVFSACARAWMDWVFALPVLGIILIYCEVTPAWTVLFTPLALLPMLFIGAGVGMLLAMLTLPVRDTAQFLPLIMTPLMLITPVFYELPQTGMWPILTTLNPMSVCIQSVRDLLFIGTLSEPVLLGAWFLASLLIFTLSWRIFCLVMPRIPEYA